MQLTALHFVIPDWSIPWIALGAAGAFFVGALRLALVLGLIPVIQLIVLPGLMPVIDQLPTWVMPVIYVVIGLLILQSAVTLMFGRETAGQLMGMLLMYLFTLVIRGPFRGLRALMGVFRS